MHYERLVDELERDKSSLQIKLTVSEEHQRLMEEAMQDREIAASREIVDLKKKLKRALN